ncbi:MAG: hypothetical protein MSA15_02170 [Clostridium sp.]|nr:hypothetical protein [Clostridium sp.]
METIIKQSADGIVLSGDNNFDTTQGKVFINNHEITDIDTFFKVAEENTRLLEQVKKYKEVIDKLKDKTKENIKNAKYEITTLTIGDKAYYQYIEKMLDNYVDILKGVDND